MPLAAEKFKTAVLWYEIKKQLFSRMKKKLPLFEEKNTTVV